MRVTQDYLERDKCIMFDYDGHDGTYVICPSCSSSFNLDINRNECPQCHTECVYPGWASW